jgi:predicted metalloprotease
MKTTLDIDDQLLSNAKVLAAQERTSLTRLIEEGLRMRLKAREVVQRGRRIRLPVFKGRGGLVAGVDPLSNKAMLDALGDDA